MDDDTFVEDIKPLERQIEGIIERTYDYKSLNFDDTKAFASAVEM